MFLEAGRLGGLEVQLVFYRGFGECKSSTWVRDGHELVRLMRGVRCVAGRTQIARVLRHAAGEARRKPVQALVFVGDCMEEDVDELGRLAGELGLLGIRAFLFHEGGESGRGPRLPPHRRADPRRLPAVLQPPPPPTCARFWAGSPPTPPVAAGRCWRWPTGWAGR